MKKLPLGKKKSPNQFTTVRGLTSGHSGAKCLTQIDGNEMDVVCDAFNLDPENGNFGQKIQQLSFAQEATEPAHRHIETARPATGELCM